MESAELLSYFEKGIDEFVEGSSGNYIALRTALSPSSAGLKLFEKPLIGIADADDPIFCSMQAPSAVGHQMRLPSEWLKNAQSVISYFLPMTERVRESNKEAGPVSPEWLHARMEGQIFVMKLGEHIVRLAKAAGVDAVCPSCHPDFSATHNHDDPSQAYRSNWSERHVAYACGLGTFSLTRGIITEKGTAGRLGSVVVSAKLPVTERPYSDIYEYCIRCGECIDRCPVNAISLESGKDNKACHQEVSSKKELYPGYIGCGKCQVGVPCEHARP